MVFMQQKYKKNKYLQIFFIIICYFLLILTELKELQIRNYLRMWNLKTRNQKRHTLKNDSTFHISYKK